MTPSRPKPNPSLPRLRLWLLLLLLLAGTSQASPPPFVITSPPEQARLTIYSEFLEDRDGTLTLQALLRGAASGDFQPASYSLQRLGISDKNWWVRIALRNEHSEPQTLTLSLDGVVKTRLFSPDELGRYLPAPRLEAFPSRYPVYLLSLMPGETQLLYAQLQGQGPLQYGLTLNHLQTQPASGFINSDRRYMLLAGVLLGLSLYSLFAFALGRGYTYLYQSGFVMALLLACLSLAGFIHAEQNPLFRQPLFLYSCGIFAIYAAAGVARHFLNTAEHSPALNNALRAMELAALLILLVLGLLPTSLAGSLTMMLGLISALLLLGLGYLSWYRQFNGSDLYFLTTTLIGLPVVFACLVFLGHLQTTLDIPLWLMAALIIQGSVLNIGLYLKQQQQNRMEMELQRSQAIADTVETTRRETLSRIGHDVRTPLSGILGMSEILNDTPLTPNQRECVSGIQNAGENLLRIISDVLEYSQLTTQGTDINRGLIDLNELVMDAIDLFRERAEEKQLELITHVHTNVSARVEGDGSRLRQALTNLIGALVRHGRHGELMIDVSMEPTGRADQVRFELSGSAISNDTMKGLQQSRQNQDSSHLNLAIAEQLVDAMGGRIGTHTDSRSGHHYWFILPLPAAEPPASNQQQDTALLSGKRLLVVDDSNTVTRVLRHHALSWGMRVTACHDPKEALASLRTQANINEPFDVVILDQQMPEMNGLQLAARIHEDPVITHPTVVIMLTGVNHVPSATEARNVGIHRVLSKPVSAPRLKQALSEQLNQSDNLPLPGPTDPRQAQQPDPDLRLLVAEDHHLSQKVIRGMLGKLGLKADMANNGKEALALVKQHRYDLILMDCEMPEMDGFEATRLIRQYEKDNGLPPTAIIALTAHILREHRERSLASGMNAHLPKPVELNTLRATVVRFTDNGGGEKT